MTQRPSQTDIVQITDFVVFGDTSQLASSGFATRIVNGNATLDDTYKHQILLVNTLAANIDLGLPEAALSQGYFVTIYKTLADYAININPDGSDTINGLSQLQLKKRYSAVSLFCNGVNWKIFRNFLTKETFLNGTLSSGATWTINIDPDDSKSMVLEVLKNVGGYHQKAIEGVDIVTRFYNDTIEIDNQTGGVLNLIVTRIC
jgi:hypothetical protein